MEGYWTVYLLPCSVEWEIGLYERSPGSCTVCSCARMSAVSILLSLSSLLLLLFAFTLTGLKPVKWTGKGDEIMSNPKARSPSFQKGLHESHLLSGKRKSVQHFIYYSELSHHGINPNTVHGIAPCVPV